MAARVDGLPFLLFQETQKKNMESKASKDFRDILHERIASSDKDMEKAKSMQRELQKMKEQRQITEIIRRIMPDGSIQVTKYSEGKIESRYRQYPPLRLKPDTEAEATGMLRGQEIMDTHPVKLVPEWSPAKLMFQ